MVLWRKLLPFAAAAVVLGAGVWGLLLNWHLAALGWSDLPGLRTTDKMTYFLALAPTAYQAYVYFYLSTGSSVRGLWEEHPVVAVMLLLLTVIEVNFVRMGLLMRALEDGEPVVGLMHVVTLGIAIMVALGAEAMLVTATVFIRTGADRLWPSAHRRLRPPYE